MVIYGYIWLYMVIYGYIWLYMVLYGYIYGYRDYDSIRGARTSKISKWWDLGVAVVVETN